MQPIRVAAIVDRTAIYGPGWRTAIWVQGCSLACKGCWNTSMWTKKGGEEYSAEDLVERILAADTQGVTFLGGEPLEKKKNLLPLLSDLKVTGKTIFIYSGFEFEELNDLQKECLEFADIAVLGRYIEALRDTSLRWRGSSNQTVQFLSERYSEVDMDGEASEFEVHIESDGTFRIMGYPPNNLNL